MKPTDIREQVIRYCRTKMGCGNWYDDYISDNLQEALQVAESGGGLFELDHLVNLKELLGIPVTYKMFAYVDQIYSDETEDGCFSLFDVIEIPEEQQGIKDLIFNYLSNPVEKS